MSDSWIYVLVIVVGGVIIYYGSRLLEKTAGNLSRHYGLPAAVHGAIVVAVGSSFPELSSAVLSTLLHGEFELGLSAVVGSAIFNILFIPAISTLVAGGRLKAEKLMVYKDAQFYIISVAVLLIAFSLAIIYHPVGEEELVGNITPYIALIPLLLYGLYVFIQYQEVRDSKLENKRIDNPLKTWFYLLVSLVMVVVGVEGLVRASLFYEQKFEIPSFFWGITMIAVITSLPDAFLSFRLARKGEATSSITNVLGSNVFDLLVAIPAGVLLAGGAEVDFTKAVPLMAMLTLATIILFTTMRTKLEIARWEAVVLLLTYALMMLWVVLENFSFIDLIRGI